MKKISFIVLIALILLIYFGSSTNNIYGHSSEIVKGLTVDVMKLHPPMTHFGIVFPVSLLVLEIIYLITRRKPDILEFIFIILSFLGVLAATVSGFYVYTHIDEENLSKKGLEILGSHELLGFVLTGIYSTVLGLRILYSFIKDEKKKNKIKLVYIGIVLLSVLVGFYQGFLGGELAYGELIER